MQHGAFSEPVRSKARNRAAKILKTAGKASLRQLMYLMAVILIGLVIALISRDRL